jgi:hypothetical protein
MEKLSSDRDHQVLNSPVQMSEKAVSVPVPGISAAASNVAQHKDDDDDEEDMLIYDDGACDHDYEFDDYY